MHVQIAYELFVVRMQDYKKVDRHAVITQYHPFRKHLHTNESFLILRIYGLWKGEVTNYDDK